MQIRSCWDADLKIKSKIEIHDKIREIQILFNIKI